MKLEQNIHLCRERIKAYSKNYPQFNGKFMLQHSADSDFEPGDHSQLLDSPAIMANARGKAKAIIGVEVKGKDVARIMDGKTKGLIPPNFVVESADHNGMQALWFCDKYTNFASQLWVLDNFVYPELFSILEESDPLPTCWGWRPLTAKEQENVKDAYYEGDRRLVETEEWGPINFSPFRLDSPGHGIHELNSGRFQFIDIFTGDNSLARFRKLQDEKRKRGKRAQRQAGLKRKADRVNGSIAKITGAIEHLNLRGLPVNQVQVAKAAGVSRRTALRYWKSGEIQRVLLAGTVPEDKAKGYTP